MATRPTVVTVLGVLWLVIALMMFASSGMGLLMWYSGDMREIAREPADSEMPGSAIFRYYGILAATQLVVAIIVGACAAGLFRLAPWSRIGLQLLSGLALVLIVGYTLYTAVAFSDFFQPIAEESGLIGAFFVVALVLGLVVMGTPLVLTIWALRTPSVRAAFRPQQVVA